MTQNNFWVIVLHGTRKLFSSIHHKDFCLIPDLQRSTLLLVKLNNMLANHTYQR